MTELSVVDDLGRALAALPEPPPHPRAQRPAALTAASAAVTLVLTVAALLAARGPAGALAVERDDGAVEIRLIDAAARPAALTRELRAAGVRATVLVAPATPGAIGTWVDVRAARVAGPGDDPRTHDDAFDERAEAIAERRRLRGIAIRGDRVLVPAGHPHELQLVAGVAPRGGQPAVYGVGGRAAAP